MLTSAIYSGCEIFYCAVGVSDQFVSEIAEAPAWQQAIFLALFTLVSEDLAAISGGILASMAPANLPFIFLGCWAGMWCGDMVYFLLGYYVGRPALSLPLLNRVIAAEKCDLATRWFERRGLHVLIASRVLPGTRPATYLAAGILRYKPLRFIVITLALSFIWCALLVLVSMRLGDQLLQWARSLELGFLGPILTILLILLLLILISKLPARRWHTPNDDT